jgi:hypothetical protein
MKLRKPEERHIDEYELEWARQHVDLLRKYAYGDTLRYWVLAIIFITGGVVTVIAYLIAAGKITITPAWRAEFWVDALLNVGIAFWSSALVVFLIEVFVDVQKRLSQQYLA